VVSVNKGSHQHKYIRRWLSHAVGEQGLQWLVCGIFLAAEGTCCNHYGQAFRPCIHATLSLQNCRQFQDRLQTCQFNGMFNDGFGSLAYVKNRPSMICNDTAHQDCMECCTLMLIADKLICSLLLTFEWFADTCMTSPKFYSQAGMT